MLKSELKLNITPKRLFIGLALILITQAVFVFFIFSTLNAKVENIQSISPSGKYENVQALTTFNESILNLKDSLSQLNDAQAKALQDAVNAAEKAGDYALSPYKELEKKEAIIDELKRQLEEANASK